MKRLSLRNRIAFYYIVVTAALIAALFFALYFTVMDTVYTHLDSDLDAETQEVHSSIVALNDVLIFANPEEWKEKEHGQIEVNPTFVQVVDTLGLITRKTPNLRNLKLHFNPHVKTKYYFNTNLAGSPIRQLQVPIKNPTGKTLAYLIIAVPLEESEIVVKNLAYTLVIAYPIVLLVLYFISSFIAGQSLAPINKVINTAERITKENLDERIELPIHNDEIHKLTLTINSLLDRLEDVILREKQFTADASHELRTPLSVIKGTLEVLIRKPRDSKEYVEKINLAISEVNRMSLLIDQLLELARLESEKVLPTFSSFDLRDILSRVAEHHGASLNEKNIQLKLETQKPLIVNADISMTEIILENLLSNAIKYSFQNGKIAALCNDEKDFKSCSIIDYGLGIPEEHIHRIFDRFYRVDTSRNSQLEGKGIGLSIVKRLADMQNIQISVTNNAEGGTTFKLTFPS